MSRIQQIIQRGTKREEPGGHQGGNGQSHHRRHLDHVEVGILADRTAVEHGEPHVSDRSDRHGQPGELCGTQKPDIQVASHDT